MSTCYSRGNPVSRPSREATDRLDRVFEMRQAYHADPLAEVDGLIAEHPRFALAHAFRAGALPTATDRTFEPERVKSLAATHPLAVTVDERERPDIAACRAWLDRGWERGTEFWGRASIDHPHDLLALQFARLGDFSPGHTHLLRDRVARVLPPVARANRVARRDPGAQR